MNRCGTPTTTAIATTTTITSQTESAASTFLFSLFIIGLYADFQGRPETVLNNGNRPTGRYNRYVRSPPGQGCLQNGQRVTLNICKKDEKKKLSGEIIVCALTKPRHNAQFQFVMLHKGHTEEK